MRFVLNGWEEEKVKQNQFLKKTEEKESQGIWTELCKVFKKKKTVKKAGADTEI